jgi:cysteine desulfurase
MTRAGTYLDYNATAPIKPAVREAMIAALDTVGNPSSVHGFGRAARRLVEDARGAVAALVGVKPVQVIFTAGGTEANNLALRGTGRRRILGSAIEHDSVLEAVPEAERFAVTAGGGADLDALDRLIRRDSEPALVSLMLANNETGVIQPVGEAAGLVHGHGGILHCDAVQAAGRIPVDFGALGVDLLTLTAHKLGGPTGVGALVVREALPLAALLRGGGQEQRRRAGTENLIGIAGFGAAARAALEDLAGVPRLGLLRSDLEQRLRATGAPVRFFGVTADRVANTTCVAMPGVSSETQIMAFDLAGIAVSAGAACSSGKVKPSHVLTAMGVSPDEAATAIRVSLGWRTSADDIDRFVAAWEALYRRKGGTADRASAA